MSKKPDTTPAAPVRPGVKSARVGLISLGCAKNLVDAEIMLGTLLRDGFEITNDAREADVLIVNTCAFVDAAQEESVDAILESAEVRENRNPGQGLIVSGCLPQRFRNELPKLLPEVDAFMGVDQVAGVTDIVKQALARRAEKIRQQAKPRAGRRTSKVAKRLAELNRRNGASRENPDESVRGMAAPNETLPASDSHIGNGSPQLTKSSADAPLVDVHTRPNYIPDYATPRFRLTARHFAYVKIAEGCNHPCSFCTIPRMRGAHRSRALPDIVAEARALLAEGVKELNLISQDSTYYGLDLRAARGAAISAPAPFNAAVRALPAGTPTICSLLRELDALPGEFWIRLLYTHPAHWTDELIHTIAQCRKVARYVDIPLQHIHENMLERMRRETSRQHIVDLLARIRAGVPGIALRTTFIVGFPGETQAHFSALMDFICETKFERLGVFTYSQEDATRAGKMAGQVPERTKRERRDLAMALQREVAARVSAAQSGRTMRVLVEKKAGADELPKAAVRSWEHGLVRGAASADGALEGLSVVARGEADAPDIDGRVYVRGKLPVGEFADVRIVGHTDYDLIAVPA